MHAPFIMKLILHKETGCPLVATDLVIHNPIKPQKKGLVKVCDSGASGSRAPFCL
jgi:hypothetical protein